MELSHRTFIIPAPEMVTSCLQNAAEAHEVLLRIEGTGAAARRAAEAAATAPGKDAAATLEKYLPEISQAVAVRSLLTGRPPTLTAAPRSPHLALYVISCCTRTHSRTAQGATITGSGPCL